MRTAFNPLGSNIKIDTVPIQFNYTGYLQEYIVPIGVKKMQINCVGAVGAKPTGKYFGNKRDAGNGGKVECILSVASKQILYIYVGKEPSDIKTPEYNASDVRTSNTDLLSEEGLNSRIIVAGGGGNGAEQNWSGWNAGHGGGLIGGSTENSYGLATGGTQSEGGKCTNYSSPYGSQAGGSGQFGLGGNGSQYASAIGGAGGAGWYGGAGGNSFLASNITGVSDSRGGAGGSSYTHPELCSEVLHTQGFQNGNGYVIIAPIK